MRDLLAKCPLDVSSLGRAPLEECGFLPALSGVYLVLDPAGRVWYVGKAVSIRERFADHEKMPLFRDAKASLVAYQTEADEAAYSQLEQRLIEHFRPPLNSQHNFKTLPLADFGLTPEEEAARYLQLRVDQKLIELQLAALAPNIVSQCEQAGGKLVHAMGTLWYQTTESYAYSEECEAQRKQMLARQKREREDGTAVVKGETTTPRYRLNASTLSAEVTRWMGRYLGEESAEGAGTA